MNIETHLINGKRTAEVLSENVLINTAEDGLDLLGNLYYQEFDQIILYEKNISPVFFDLRTGLAGELLQKFSNYRVRLAIVGNFENYQSKSLRDFIYESNAHGHILFAVTKQEAIERLMSR